MERLEKRLKPGDSPIDAFLTQAALENRNDTDQEADGPQVTLMTLHSAKGLEYPYVFLVGIEEDILPHRKTVELGGDVDEERRLFYVGVTRAQSNLCITWSHARIRHGALQKCGPSRFLSEVPDSACVARRGREDSPSDQDPEELANEFFRRMRSQLGMDAKEV